MANAKWDIALRLLPDALYSDGGGITGLSTLLIIREIMLRLQGVNRGANQQTSMRPCDYFDTIAGTGTGAISAVMLGRLHMTIDDAITSYNQLMKTVFSERKYTFLGDAGAYKATTLEKELKDIIHRMTGDKDEPMLDNKSNNRNNQCKVVVYAMSSYNMTSALPVAFRSYLTPNTAVCTSTIWQALRATTTHPEMFKSIEIDTEGTGILDKFVRGGLGCSNPTAYLLEEAQRVYPDREVTSIISIGSGHPKVIKVEEGNPWRVSALRKSTMTRVMEAAYEMAEGSERTAEEMERRFANVDSVYYRLNLQQGTQGIEADEWKRLDEVAAHTRAYLGQGSMQSKLSSLIKVVSTRTGALSTAQIGGQVTGGFESIQDSIQSCPPSSIRFTGRERHTEMVRTYFTRGSQGRYVFVLYGLGGSGKTQIALKCVEDLKERFAHVLFFDASSDDTIRTSLATVALENNLGKGYTCALAWIGRNAQSCLLVLDNADDPTVDIQAYIPQSKDYSVLITTRCPEFVALAGEDAAACNVSGLEETEAVELLLKSARLRLDGMSEVDKEMMYQLLKSFDYLALAIVQSGAYIWKMQQSISQYWEKYSARQQIVPEGISAPRLGLDGYTRTVFTTWNLSLNQLGLCAQELLFLISFLHRDGILEETFVRAARNAEKYNHPDLLPPNSPVVQVTQRVTDFLSRCAEDGQRGDGFSNYFGELLSFSLITHNRVSRAYSIHPLVQSWAQAAAPLRSISSDHSAVLLGLSIDWGKTHTDYAYKRRILPHVNLVVEQSQVCNLNIAEQFAEVFRAAGQFNKEGAIWEGAIAVWKQQLGEDHPKTLGSMNSLAVVYEAQGKRTTARGLHETVLATQVRTLGENHPDTLKTKHRLGWCMHQQRHYAEAEALLESVVVARKQVLGQEHPDTLESMDDLASSYEAKGRLTEAETLQMEVLAIRKQMLGEDHVDTLEGMHNLAFTYQKQGRVAEAEVLYVTTIAARKQVLGEDHPHTINSMHCLALTYREQGRLAEVEAMYATVVAARKRVLGEDHANTLVSMNNLALAYQEQGRLARAEALYVTVVAAMKRVLGEDHLETLNSMNNLADTYREQGRLDEAEALYTTVVAARKRVLGEDHTHTLVSMNNLALTYQEQGRLARAEALYVNVVAAMKRVLGEDHLETLNSMNNLANTYRQQGRRRLHEAQALYENVVATRKRILGEDHAHTLTSMNNLALAYQEQGRLVEAEALYVNVVAAMKRVLGEDHLETFTSMNNLGVIYYFQDRFAEAEALFIAVLASRRRVLGSTHPRTIASMKELENTYSKLGKFAERDALKSERAAI